MTLSLNCKDAGDPICTHTMYGETEEELLQNAKKHGMEVHGYTEQSWNEEVAKNGEHFRKIKVGSVSLRGFAKNVQKHNIDHDIRIINFLFPYVQGQTQKQNYKSITIFTG